MRDYCPYCDQLVDSGTELAGDLGMLSVCPTCRGVTELPRRPASYEPVHPPPTGRRPNAYDHDRPGVPVAWREQELRKRRDAWNMGKAADQEACAVPGCGQDGVWCQEGLALCLGHKRRAHAMESVAERFGERPPMAPADYIRLAQANESDFYTRHGKGLQGAMNLVG